MRQTHEPNCAYRPHPPRRIGIRQAYRWRGRPEPAASPEGRSADDRLENSAVQPPGPSPGDHRRRSTVGAAQRDTPVPPGVWLPTTPRSQSPYRTPRLGSARRRPYRAATAITLPVALRTAWRGRESETGRYARCGRPASSSRRTRSHVSDDRVRAGQLRDMPSTPSIAGCGWVLGQGMQSIQRWIDPGVTPGGRPGRDLDIGSRARPEADQSRQTHTPTMMISRSAFNIIAASLRQLCRAGIRVARTPTSCPKSYPAHAAQAGLSCLPRKPETSTTYCGRRALNNRSLSAHGKVSAGPAGLSRLIREDQVLCHEFLEGIRILTYEDRSCQFVSIRKIR